MDDRKKVDQQRWPPAPKNSINTAAPPVKRPRARVIALEIVQGAGFGLAAGILFPILVAIADIFSDLSQRHCGYATFALPLVPELFIAWWLCGKGKSLGWAFGIVSITLSVLIGGVLAVLSTINFPPS